MFNKMLFLNFKQSDLPPVFWRRIKAMAKQRILAKEGSREAKRHLTGTDCLILKLGMGAASTH